MNARVALCMALLEGRVLSVANCFKEIGLTNIGRELPRMVEKPFGVEISRTPKASKNRYGSPVSYTSYRLNNSDHNLKGIELMRSYVEANGGYVPPEKRPVGRPKEKTTPSNNDTRLF